MVLQFWETVKEAIAAYTGLSPAAFFTVLALAVAVYYAVSALFVSPGHHPRPRSLEEMVPLSPPVQLGEVTEGELKAYDGSDPKKPLLMAIKGQIYDVSQSRMFYGPGGPYALFAGRDASRALAKMSFEPVDLTGDVSGLGPFELEALQDWEYKFMSKYVKVGTIKEEEAQVSNGSTITEEPVAEAIDRDVVSPKSTAVESAEHGDRNVVSPKSTVAGSTDHGAAYDDDAAKYKSGIKEPLSPTDHGTGAVENAEAQVQNGVVGVNE